MIAKHPIKNGSTRPSNFFNELRPLSATPVLTGHSWPPLKTSDVPTLSGVKIHQPGLCTSLRSASSHSARAGRALPGRQRS